MPDKDTVRLLTYSAAATVAGLLAVSLATSGIAKPVSRKIIPSPRTTLLPRLSPAQTKSLGYPPDALPGARDVSTPYGSMRVYEWGPLDGRKVILVHGDATPSPLFGKIATELVNRGCRVLTFDSWGRGYTDTPSGVQHDSRLYTQQILYAITSSSLHWTGQSRFSLVGFSMGASIVLDFFAHHPSLVESVVLLGPGGLIRKLPPTYTRFFFRYPGLVSASRMRNLIGTLLGVSLTNSKTGVSVKDKPEGFTPAGALQFQFDHHEGHVESLLSNVQYGPIIHQDETWAKAGSIIVGRAQVDSPLCGGKILVICGREDDVILADDVRADLATYMGEEEGKHWLFDTVPGDHGFPWPEGTTIGKKIADFWEL